MKSETIHKVFPIFSVENNLIVSKKGDISIAFKLELPQIYSLDKVSIARINRTFDKFIRSFPGDTIIQKQDYFYQEKIEKPITDSDYFLSRSDNFYFFNKPTSSHECFLFITKSYKKKTNLNNRTTGSKVDLNEAENFIKIANAGVSYLQKEEFFNITKLDNAAIINTINKYFSLSQSGDGILTDLFFDKILQVGQNFGEIYAITSPNQLPINLSPTRKNVEFSTQKTDFQIPFFQPLSMGLDCNHIYNQVIYIDNSENMFSKLKTKLNQFKSLAILSKENEVIYNQIDDLVHTVIEDELKLINQHYNIIVWNTNKVLLENNVSQLKNAFKELGITPFKISHGIKDLFLYNTPGATSYIPNAYRFTGISEQAPIFLNFESYYKDNINGILLCDRKNGSPVRIDLWDAPLKNGLIVNRNRLIFGPSGTGKSFLINHIASQYYEQGHHIVMIDIGNSYKKLCQLVNGKYYAYDVDKPLSFNPFFVKDIKEMNTDKKVFLTSIILFLWKGDDPFKREEKQIIALYIDKFYEYIFSYGNNIFPNLSSFYEFVDKNEVMENENIYFDKISFQLSLKDFHTGKYKQVLNSKDKINLSQERFIVFEMDNIKDDPVLFPLITMLCIDVIMEKIRTMPEVKKSIFIDECWKPISKGEMVEFIKYLYKTVRKFYGEVAIATQDVEDILDTTAGPAMINNTDTMILLSHKKKMATKDKFANYLSFSESDLEKLFSTDKREVFIKMGNISNVYKVGVSPERYACYTSNADENDYIFRTYNKNNNMKLTLNEFVEINKN